METLVHAGLSNALAAVILAVLVAGVTRYRRLNRTDGPGV